MRYMMLYKPGVEGHGPSEEEMRRMGEFVQEGAENGTLLATDGLLPSSFGFQVAYNNGDPTVTDGPFTETKELVAGFAIVEVGSREEAEDLARRFLDIVKSGVSEVRLMPDQPAYLRPPASAESAR